MSQHHGTVYKIAEDGDEFGIVTGLEFFPAEIVVLGFGSVGGKYISQHIFLPGEILHVFMSPDGPTTGSGDFVALKVQEFIRRNVLRKDEPVAISLQHRREHNAMENYIVLAYKMHKFRVRAFPPFFPTVRKKFHGIGYITNRGIEPNIENLPFSTFYGHGNSPVEVSGNSTWLKPPVEPAFYLAVNVAAPFLVSFQYPFAKPAFIVLQRQIPMGGFAFYRLGTAET